MKPSPAEYAPYFERYISLVPDDDIVAVLDDQVATVRSALGSLSDTRAGFRYAPDKWSVREVTGHLSDTERVFGYRALWFARGGGDALPGFDQDPFARAAGHDRYPIAELVDEFCALRESHILMFRHLDINGWQRSGMASGQLLSVRAAAFIMAGHLTYHAASLRDQYGVVFGAR